MKVLTIEDSATVRKIIADAAALLGFETVEAENGDAGLKVLEAEGDSIHLILLDWNMPGLTGMQVLDKIKAHEKWYEIPVMMVTSESERTSVLEAIRKGAVSYATKPFTAEDLITKMMQALEAGA